MKNIYRFFSFGFISVLLTINSLFALPPEGIVLNKISSGYSLSFTLPDYQFISIYAGGEEYLQLTVPGYGVTPDVGLPALPLASFNLFIAYDEGQPEFDIINVVTEEKILSKKIFPFQMPWEKSNPFDERPFTINRDYYNSAGIADQPLLKISEPFITAGVKGVMVTIFPFKYNPVENRLMVVKSASFNINLKYAVLPILDKSKSINEFFKSLFINYEGIPDNLAMNYLIITAPQFETVMQQYVVHKNSKGFNAEMFNTNITGTTTTAIKNFIQQRYNDPQTRPEFVLLVGVVAEIPAWAGSGSGSPRTDLNYIQLEGGGYFPDAFIGRFSVADID